MKTCMNCGTAIDDVSVFCPVCGAAVTNDPAPAPDWSATVSNVGVTTGVANATHDVAYGKGRLVSSDEQVVATLRNDFVDNLITGEGFKNEDAMITNKRLYYKHTKGLIDRYQVEEIVNLEDITGVKILNANPLFLLILAGLFFVGSLALSQLARNGFILVFGGLFALILVIIYFCILKKYLRIEYAGGSISFSVRRYGMANIRAFQKSIFLAKEMYKVM